MATVKPLKTASGVTQEMGSNDVIERGNLPNRWRDFYIPAGAFAPVAANPADPVVLDYPTNDFGLDAYSFDDTTEESISIGFKMPDAWDRTELNGKIYWTPAADPEESSGVVWKIEFLTRSNDEVIDATLTAAATITDANLSAGDLHETAAAALTIDAPKQGDLVIIKISRDVAHEDDDQAEDAHFFGLALQYKESATIDPADWAPA